MPMQGDKAIADSRLMLSLARSEAKNSQILRILQGHWQQISAKRSRKFKKHFPKSFSQELDELNGKEVQRQGQVLSRVFPVRLLGIQISYHSLCWYTSKHHRKSGMATFSKTVPVFEQNEVTKLLLAFALALGGAFGAPAPENPRKSMGTEKSMRTFLPKTEISDSTSKRIWKHQVSRKWRHFLSSGYTTVLYNPIIACWFSQCVCLLLLCLESSSKHIKTCQNTLVSSFWLYTPPSRCVDANFAFSFPLGRRSRPDKSTWNQLIWTPVGIFPKRTDMTYQYHSWLSLSNLSIPLIFIT